MGFLFLSSSVPLLCGGWRGLVGLLFEICIVDASIFIISLEPVAYASSLALVVGGWWCGGLGVVVSV